MFYPNRQALGDELAMRLSDFRDTDTIILCLKRSSLLSCIELAANLHAYIYILQYSEIPDPYNITRSLGAITNRGEFVLNPDISPGEYEYILQSFMSVIEERKRTAFSEINAEEDPNNGFDINFCEGRNVILFADVLKTSFQIQVAETILKTVTPNYLIGAVGNITSDISDKFNMDTDGVVYMDVLQNNLFDDDHYFDEADPYSDEEKIIMANNISLYWV